ncbi:vancomycin resistance protein VanW [Natranaerovirga hydrolytica]|uniref:Vancomycin resistance protein VanW n=1 Tax=Natranaerovirga hydrolytica TaxID=680378 RepID=A0A4R1MJL8_9FIRM|nr:VanW family protein [Natranaerovirga hydrolytica]TCK92916.1 vancomycin resistance protein VanW [Natranaerovirga hydrolytica]
MGEFKENIHLLKPKSRSNLRVLLGKKYYTYKRYMKWYLGKEKYAKSKEEELFKYVFFTHRTPLYRQLKDVDMWYQHNKVKNLKVAIKQLNKITIKPRETFSYWKLIGKPTKRKGFVNGMVLYYGNYKSGVGGGLCQLSNLIYWMTLHTPLTVIERYRHSYDVFPDSKRTQPFGSGATCVYNYRDLGIYNNTEETYRLHLYLTENELVGEWRTHIEPYCKYEVYEKEHVITQEYWGDYLRHNSIYRKSFDLEGCFLDDEYITENHAIMMYQPFLENDDSKIHQK